MFEALFSAAWDGILVADATTRKTVYANPALLRLLRHPGSELPDLPPDHLIAGPSGATAILPCGDGSSLACQLFASRLILDGRDYLLAVLRPPGAPPAHSDPGHAGIPGSQVELDLRIKEAALASAVAGISIADPHGRITYANHAWLDMFGLQAESEALGATAHQHVADAADAQAIIEALRERGAWMGELNCRRRDGSTFPAVVSAGFLRAPSGEPLCMMASFQDITRYRHSEAALHSAAARLREAQEIANIGNWDLDVATGNLWWSDQIYRLFELDPQSFAASYEAFLSAIHPDDRDAVHAAYTGSLRTRAPYRITHRLLMADGRVKYVEERCTTDFDAAGVPLRSRGTVQDVTASVLAQAELQATRDALEATLQAIPDLLFEMDQEGRYLAVHARQPGLLAVPQDQLLGRSVRDVLPAEAAATVLAALDEAAREGVAIGQTISLEVPDGQRWFELSVARKAAWEAKPTFILLSRDITRRARAEQQLRQSVVEKEVMLREIHHRVKNNLQIVSSLLYFQSKKLKDPLDHTLLAEVRERMRAMMLVHAHLYQSSSLTRIRMADFTRSLLAQLAEAYHGRQRRIATRLQSDDLSLPIEVAQPCGLIICELVTNAFKHAFPAGYDGEVDVRIACTPGRVEITVADNGAGWPEGFDLEGYDSFGWQSIRGFCLQLNGTLSLGSGHGATVTISFPYVEEVTG